MRSKWFLKKTVLLITITRTRSPLHQFWSLKFFLHLIIAAIINIHRQGVHFEVIKKQRPRPSRPRHQLWEIAASAAWICQCCSVMSSSPVHQYTSTQKSASTAWICLVHQFASTQISASTMHCCVPILALVGNNLDAQSLQCGRSNPHIQMTAHFVQLTIRRSKMLVTNLHSFVCGKVELDLW